MIKKYGQFIKGKTNEEFHMDAEPEQSPDPSTTPTISPTENPPRPRPERPEIPSITPSHIPSEEDAPMAKSDSMEEEEGDYKGQTLMAELANKLGVEVEDNAINYNGKIINFYSEDEKFYVDRKKFETPDEVIEYLESGRIEDRTRRPVRSIENRNENRNESKSYKRSRFKL